MVARGKCCINPACRKTIPRGTKGIHFKDKKLKHFCPRCRSKLSQEDMERLINYHQAGLKRSRLPVCKCWDCRYAVPTKCKYILLEDPGDLPWIEVKVAGVRKPTWDHSEGVPDTQTRCEYCGSIGYQPQQTAYAVVKCEHYKKGELPPLEEGAKFVIPKDLPELQAFN